MAEKSRGSVRSVPSVIIDRSPSPFLNSSHDDSLVRPVRASVVTDNDTQGFVGLYNFKEKIGRGHFGVVRLAEHALTKETVAVKIIDKNNLDAEIREQLYNEVRFMKLLKHPHIISLYEVCETPTQLYLILELADGGDLFDKISQNGRLSEEISRQYFRQILSAVMFCHSLHIAHRDLKPENVLLVGDIVKVSDFGMSADFSPGIMLDTAVGSLAYSAPEILLGDKYYGEGVDVWSLGVTLYMMTCGQLPFDDANPSETVVNIMEGTYWLDATLSPELRDLLVAMLTVDPSKRISLTGIASHPWVTNGGADPLDSMIEEEELTPVEMSQIMATLVTLKIDPEQVKRDIANNVHNYNVATYHLLRLQLLRERREKMRRKSALSMLSVPKRGLRKSPSSEDTVTLKADIKSPPANVQRTFSAEGVGVMGTEMIDSLKKMDAYTQPGQTQPSPATSQHTWRFGANRKARLVSESDAEVGGHMIKAHSSPSRTSINVAEESGPSLARQRAKATSVSMGTLARTTSPLGPSSSMTDIAAPVKPATLFRGNLSSQSEPDIMIPVKVDRPASSLNVTRNINLISEESGEDDASGASTPRGHSRPQTPPDSPGSGFYKSPHGARSMPHLVRARAATGDRLAALNPTASSILVPMADPDSPNQRGSPRTQRQDTTISVQSAPALAHRGQDECERDAHGLQIRRREPALSPTASDTSSRKGAIKQRLRGTVASSKRNCTIS